MADRDFIISRIRFERDMVCNNNNDSAIDIRCLFKTTIKTNEVNHCLALLGSQPQLGDWNPNTPILAARRDGSTWEAIVEIPPNNYIEYKWVTYNAVNGRLVEYEPGCNRKLWVNNVSMMIEDYTDGGQKITKLSEKELANLVQSRHVDTLADELARHELECQSRLHQDESQGYIGLSKVNVEEKGQSSLESTVGSMIKRNRGTLLKVGLLAGAAVTAFFVYKRFFK